MPSLVKATRSLSRSSAAGEVTPRDDGRQDETGRLHGSTQAPQDPSSARLGRLSSTPARQAAVLAAATGSAQIVLAGIFVVGARLTSPLEFGVVGTAYAMSLVGAAVVDFGTNALWTRELISARLTSEDLRARAAGKVVIAAVLAAVMMCVGLIVLPESALALAGPLLVGTVVAQTAQVPLRARLRSDLVAAATISDRLAALVVFGACLLVPGMPVVLALVGALCCGLAADAALALRFDRALRRPRRPVLPYSGTRHYGLMSLAVSAQSLDVVAISALGGPVQAGLFAAVNRWTSAMGLLVTAFSSATTPFVARAGSLRAALPHLKSALWMPCGAILCCIGTAVAAPWVVELLLGPAYADSADVLQILALAIVPAVVAQPLATYLQALGHDRVVGVVLTVIVVVQLIGVAIASGTGGIVAVAAMIALGQLAMAVSLALIVGSVWRSDSSSSPAAQA